MSTKFIAYAIEHFDGTPTEYSFDVCDSDIGEHIIDVTNPNLSIDVHFEGSLDNPYDLLRLKEFCQEHSVPCNLQENNECSETEVYDMLEERPTYFKCDELLDDIADRKGISRAELDKQCEDYLEKSYSGSSFESASATEGPLDAIKSMVSKQQVKFGNAKMTDMTPFYQSNLKVIDRAIVSQRLEQAMITPEQVARYYATNLTKGQPFYMLMHQQLPTGDKRGVITVKDALPDSYIDIRDNDFDTVKDPNKLFVQAAAQVLQRIKNEISSNKNYTLIGYTTDAAQAQKFKESLEEGSAYSASTDVKTLQAAWAKVTDEGDRLKILNKVFESKRSLIPKEVKAYLVAQDNPFDNISWKLVQYHLKTGTTPMNPKVFDVITKTRQLIVDLDNGESLEGLDLSSPIQFQAILRTEKLPKGNLANLKVGKEANGPWLSVKEMEPINNALEEELKKVPEDKPSTSSRGGRKTPSTDGGATVSTKGLKAQLNNLLKNPESHRDLIKIIKSLGITSELVD